MQRIFPSTAFGGPPPQARLGRINGMSSLAHEPGFGSAKEKLREEAQQ